MPSYPVAGEFSVNEFCWTTISTNSNSKWANFVDLMNNNLTKSLIFFPDACS